MTAPAIEQVQIQVPARVAALAWLNAFLATSSDENRPALYKTLCIEFFEGGVQIVCTDGTALFRTWAPCNEGDPWPVMVVEGRGTMMEEPDRSITVMDPDGFGIGFMRALLRVTGEEEHANEILTLSIYSADEEANLALGEEFMSERVTLRACGQRIDLRLMDGPYPDWRKVRLGIDDIERVDGMTVATRILKLVGQLKAVSAVDLEFYGDKKHIAFTARGESEVRGLLMPMQRKDQPERPSAKAQTEDEE